MYRVPLKDLPGFFSMNQYPFEQLFYENKTAVELYNQFKGNIIKAIAEKKYLPVMRMCDGEFIFCVGRKRGRFIKGYKLLRHYAGKILKKNMTSWGETYSKGEYKRLRKDFPELLKRISHSGYIANFYQYSHTHFAEEYIEPMIEWYRQHGIDMNSGNFTAFIFVYVLLNGPDSLQLFKEKNILILSSFDDKKSAAVEKELKRRGANQVYFQSISATQSMLDVLDLSPYKGKVDLALIAGGIGSANILLQCEVLNTVCIDSGFALECIADATRKKERVFCTPDQEF